MFVYHGLFSMLCLRLEVKFKTQGGAEAYEVQPNTKLGRSVTIECSSSSTWH